MDKQLITQLNVESTREQSFPITLQLSKHDIVSYAEKIAEERGFPASLAQPIG